MESEECFPHGGDMLSHKEVSFHHFFNTLIFSLNYFYYRMTENTKLNCEAILIKQWHHEQARLMEHRSLIQKYITKAEIDKSGAKSVKEDGKEIEDDLNSKSDEKQESFRSEIRSLPTGESDIQIESNYQQSFDMYKQYRKTFLNLEYRIEDHCDYHSSYMERELKYFENRIHAYTSDVL